MNECQADEPGTGPPAISVIVPFFNALATVETCARSLQAQVEAFPECEVIFCDAASTDGTGDRLRDRFADFRVTHSDSRNPYTARNRGVGLAGGEILAFTDADCAVGSAWLRSIHETMMAGADMVTGPVEPPACASTTLHRVHAYENARMERMCSPSATGAAYAYTNNLAVRADVFRSLGGFDESRTRGGDSEFVLRALGAGVTAMRYAPGMRIVHLEIDSLRRWWSKKFLYGRSGTAGRSQPSATAFRHSGASGADVATLGTLAIGRMCYEAGRVARSLRWS